MDAARTLFALTATGLEGPSEVEASRVDTVSVAKVIALGVSAEDLDPRAQAAIDFKRNAFIAFLLQATTEVRRVFGPDLRFGISEFIYPDEPDAWELHLIIESPLAPQAADAALDRLCDEWWDAAVAELGFDFFPVLGTLERG